MNYTEIVDLALAYSDREDAEVVNNMDNFLRVVESRINRVLSVQKMAIRTVLTTSGDREYYSLPLDFQGLRDIEIRDSVGSIGGHTLKYLSPEQMNGRASQSGDGGSQIYYTIIADQLQVIPMQDNKILEIVYYRNVPPLGPSTVTNWVSLYNSDLYLFGLMVEISSFIKNSESAKLWEYRFKETLSEIDIDDSLTRWSGTPLEVRVG